MDIRDQAAILAAIVALAHAGAALLRPARPRYFTLFALLSLDLFVFSAAEFLHGLPGAQGGHDVWKRLAIGSGSLLPAAALAFFLEFLGDHGEQEHGLFLYSETIRVPLIIKLPDGRHAGRRVTTPVQHIDLLPTILGLLGTVVPSDLRGRSLAPAFRGEAIPEQGLYAEALHPRYHFGWSELYALTDARSRFVRAPRDELYDIDQDAGERRNVAADRPQPAGAMRQALERLLAGAAIDSPASVSAEERERLRALGYVGSQAAATSAPGADALPDPKDKVGVLEQYRRALDLVKNGRTDEAIREFRSMASDNPGMADVWDELAGLLFRQGRVREAVEAYKREVEATAHNRVVITAAAWK